MSLSSKYPQFCHNNTSTILVIDDNSTNLAIVANYLEKSGLSVLVSQDGESGVRCAQYARPNLILLDVMMPGIDGFATCRCLKADRITKDIPIIFMTALSSTEDKIQGFEAGAVDYITKPIQPEEMLARINAHLSIQALQEKLQQQNQKLTQQSIELSHTLTNLQATQNKLIEAEKMAALGNIVAGVAHEINTPVGTSITVASTLADETQSFLNLYQEGRLKRSTLQDYLDTVNECSQLILNNLQRAGELIQSFKQVAVDQSSLDIRSFLLKSYLQEILISLEPQLKKTKHQVSISGDETIKISSYPGAIAQIVTNLVINSLHHAYQPGESGKLSLLVQKQEDKVLIEYRDDGYGVAEKDIDQIFEPFFTTARDKGGSGLGLHIVYNLVTQKLQGNIEVESHINSGTKFSIFLPLTIQLID